MIPRIFLGFALLAALTAQSCEALDIDLTPRAPKACVDCPEGETPEVGPSGPGVGPGGPV